MYFDNPKDLNELKLQYRKCAMKFHPDKGGSDEIMAVINREYEEFFKRLSLKAKKEEMGDAFDGSINIDDMASDDGYRIVLNALMNVPGIEVELCGAWLWISGATKAHKDEIKKAGCFWAAKKQMWYWRPESKSRRWNRRSVDMDDIRAKYGSTSVNWKKNKQIAG